MSCRSILVRLTMLAVTSVLLAMPGSANGNEQIIKPRTQPAVSIVTLKPGESRDVELCWDNGVGRMPVVFLSNSSDRPKDARTNFVGRPKVDLDGLAIEYDEKASSALQVAFSKDRRYMGPQPDGTHKHLTAASLHVSAKSAKPGIHPVFIHIISGTGRDMYLVAECRVLVRE